MGDLWVTVVLLYLVRLVRLVRLCAKPLQWFAVPLHPKHWAQDHVSVGLGVLAFRTAIGGKGSFSQFYSALSVTNAVTNAPSPR